MSAWNEDERKRIELYRSGWSVTLIAEYRKESVATVQRSVNKLLELLGQNPIDME
jgi:DNA-binding NarL/FixJ family response regulator